MTPFHQELPLGSLERRDNEVVRHFPMLDVRCRITREMLRPVPSFAIKGLEDTGFRCRSEAITRGQRVPVALGMPVVVSLGTQDDAGLASGTDGL